MKDIRLGKTAMFKKSQLASALVLAFGGLMVVPGVASAQDSNLQRVEVTGSRIASLNAESPAPVQVMSSADIAASGVANVQELLLKNPVFGTPTISRNNSNFNNESAGVATVDLRNLGIDRTLVLVNGRRFVSGIPGSSAVDLNTIPTDFIDRIEILTGGASSTYGSDAVAGVVNIILKKGFEGMTLDAQVGQSEKGDDDKKKFSLTAGANLADGKGNLMFHFSASKQGAVYSRDRDASAVDQASVGAFITGDPAEFFTVQRPFYSSYAPQGRFFYGGGVTPPSRTFAADGSLIRFSTNGPAGDGVGATGFNRSAFRTIAIPTDRMLMAVKGDLNIAESHTAFFEGTYANSKTETKLEPFPLASLDISRGTLGWIPAQSRPTGTIIDNPLIPTALFNLLTDTDGDGLKDYSFTRRMADIGNRGASADRDTFRVLGGLKGDLTKTWAYDAYASYGFTKEGQTSSGQVNTVNFWNALQVIPDGLGGTMCADANARANGCAPANIYGPNMSAAAAAYINAPATLNTKVTQQVFGFNVTGEPFTLPAGAVGVAAGLEHRKETSSTEHDALTISGQNGGNKLPDTSGSFTVNEYYVEGRAPLLKSLPLVKSLDGILSVRHGNYSTVGGTDSWNAGIDWALNSTVRLRATSSVSTRAPNINELYQGASQTFPTGIVDPCEGVLTTDTGVLAANCLAHPGVAANATANAGEFTLGQADQQGISGYDSGKSDLQSEKGKSKTIGLVITPKSVPMLKNFTFTADYYDIDIQNAINLPGRQYLLDQCYRLSNQKACSFITRRSVAAGGYSAGSLDLINQEYANNGGSETARGIDLTSSYSDRVGPGNLSARLTYTHLLKAEQISSAGADPDSSLGEVGNPTNKWMLNLGYDFGKLSIKSTLTYIGESYLDDQFLISYGADKSSGKIGSVTYLDLQTTYSFNKKSQLYFGIDNVMNTKAPAIITGLPGNSTGAETDAGTYDPIGRRFYIGLRYSL